MADHVYNSARHIAGDAKPIKIAGKTASEIVVGDFMYLVSSQAAPISELADSGTKAQNQAAAHAVFLGVALSAKPAGVDADIMVATEGKFRYPVAAAAAADAGSLVGPEGTGAALAVGLANQQVVSVATPDLAFGSLSKAAGSADLFYEFWLAGVLSTPYRGTQAAYSGS